MKTYIENNVLCIELNEDEVCKPIINTAPIVHIIGNGHKLTINTESPYGVAIGSEVTTVSYGRWSIYEKCDLQKVIIDNAEVIVNVTNPNFSLGTFNKQNNVDIECINGGSIKCPEYSMRSVLLYPAERPDGSTKYSTYPVYTLLKHGEEPKHTQEQIDAMGDRYEELKDVYSPYFRPKYMKFLIRNNIIPNVNFFDTNLSTTVCNILEATIQFGVQAEKVYKHYLEAAEKSSSTLILEQYMKYVMYEHIYPDFENDKVTKEKVDFGYIGYLYKKVGVEPPVVTEENKHVYMYLLPVFDNCSNVDYINMKLRDTGFEGVNPYVESVIRSDLSREFDGQYTISVLCTFEHYTAYQVLDTSDKKGKIVIHDPINKSISAFDYPYMMRSMVKMAGSDSLEPKLKYMETVVWLDEKYGSAAYGNHVVTETTEAEYPELYADIQAAIECKKAKYRYTTPVLTLLGLDYNGSVIDNTWLRG